MQGLLESNQEIRTRVNLIRFAYSRPNSCLWLWAGMPMRAKGGCINLKCIHVYITVARHGLCDLRKRWHQSHPTQCLEKSSSLGLYIGITCKRKAPSVFACSGVPHGLAIQRSPFVWAWRKRTEGQEETRTTTLKEYLELLHGP